MSRNNRSDTLVATVSSLTIGLAVALSRSPAIKDLQNEIGEKTQNWIEYLIAQLIPHGTTPSPTPLVDSCRPPEPEENDNDKLIADYRKACEEIYEKALLAVKNERYKTNNQASQEGLERVSRQAAEKKRRELRAAGIVVTTGTTLLIAGDAVADSAN